MSNSIGAALAAIAANTSAAVSHATLPPNVPNVNDKTGTTTKLTVAQKKERDSEVRYIRQKIEIFGHFDKLPEDRREGLVEMGIACSEEADHREAFSMTFAVGVIHLFPSAKSVDWKTYNLAQRFVRYAFGDRAYRIFRVELKELCAYYGINVPTAGTGTSGSNIKGLTPHKYAQGVTSSFTIAIDKAMKGKKMRDKLDARTMAEVVDVCRAVRVMLAHVNKAVNE